MRGYDYRAPTKGITLIIGASFNNYRELYQGLSRVGRYNDYCKRYKVDGIPIVDEKKELEYRASLLEFMSKFEKKIIHSIPK